VGAMTETTKKTLGRRRVAPKPGEAFYKLDELGIDAICDRILDGESQKSIARSLKIDQRRIAHWLALDEAKSAKMREAQRLSSKHWDEEAERVLKAIKDNPGSIARARELASHYRWRAKVYNPRDYGDRVDVNGTTKVVHLVNLGGRGSGEAETVQGEVITTLLKNG
jgi:hypothetical protein